MDNFGIIFLFCWACSCKLVTHMCVHCACAFFLQRAKMKMNIFKKKTHTKFGAHDQTCMEFMANMHFSCGNKKCQ